MSEVIGGDFSMLLKEKTPFSANLRELPRDNALTIVDP
jgi:hypothetical protein